METPQSLAAVVQAAPVLFDTPRTLEKLGDLAGDAARRGAKLVVFPEAFVGGYPKGLDFGARVGMRLPEGREEFRRYFESAIDVPGPATEALGAAARDPAVHLVVGVIERDGGTLYCTVAVLRPGRPLLGKHRKLMPTAMERLVWGYGDGSTLPVVRHAARQARRGDLLGELHAAAAHGDVRQGRPALLRADRGRPRHLAADHAPHRPARAAASCCRPASSSTPRRLPARLPRRVQGDDPETVLIRGGSCIVGPLGEGAGRARRIDGEEHPRRRPRPGRHRPGQVRLRRRRPLRPARRLPAARQRAAPFSRFRI